MIRVNLLGLPLSTPGLPKWTGRIPVNLVNSQQGYGHVELMGLPELEWNDEWAFRL